MRWLLGGGVLAAIVMGSLQNAGSAWACSCVALEPADYLRQADVVFSGTVRNVERDQIPGKDEVLGRVYRVNLAVDRAYKGNPQATVVVETGEGGGMCGVEFTPGTTYLVYAKGSGNGVLTTNLCAGTLALADAAGRLPSLGVGKAVQPAVTPPYRLPTRQRQPATRELAALSLKAAGVFGALAVLVHLLTLEYSKRKTL